MLPHICECSVLGQRCRTQANLPTSLSSVKHEVNNCTNVSEYDTIAKEAIFDHTRGKWDNSKRLSYKKRPEENSDCLYCHGEESDEADWCDCHSRL